MGPMGSFEEVFIVLMFSKLSLECLCIKLKRVL